MNTKENTGLKLEECINEVCPWSGKPVDSSSLTTYRSKVVGFCNPGCRDKFVAATTMFDQAQN
jgi:hypothetical protein